VNSRTDLRFRCRECSAEVVSSSENAGLTTVCPGCARAIRVPADPLSTFDMPAPDTADPADTLSVNIRFVCPACKCKLRIDVAAAGRRVACVRCRRTIRVPSLPSRDGPPAAGAAPHASPGSTATSAPPSRGTRMLSIEIRFVCQECRAKLRVDAVAAGTRVICTSCGKRVHVPVPPGWAQCADEALPPAPAVTALFGGARGPVLTAEEVEFMTRPDTP
jgi:DNA-directed RNA polymerase subunit RPC12/RpoP